MTSNLGSDFILEKVRMQKKPLTEEEILHTVNSVLKEHFRPEFLNRLDEILPFLPLQESDMEKIVLIQLQRTVHRLTEKNITLHWEKPVVHYLAEKGYDALYGARPLKRLIQQEVVNLLSVAILKDEIKEQTTVTLLLSHAKNGKMSLSFILNAANTASIDERDENLLKKPS